jgi:hypothetical protein
VVLSNRLVNAVGVPDMGTLIPVGQVFVGVNIQAPYMLIVDELATEK